jgi:hypothetical protein
MLEKNKEENKMSCNRLKLHNNVRLIYIFFQKMNQPLEKRRLLDNVDISTSPAIDESKVENCNQKTTTDVAYNDYPVSAY